MENLGLEKEQVLHKKVALHTLGCRLNFSETGSIAQGFSDRGYEIVEFGNPADVYFINTCTVTDQADSTCRNLIRKAYTASPEATIVVAGCYAQMDPEAIAKMQGVDLVLGTSEKYKVFEYLEDEREQIIAVDKTTDFWSASTTEADTHTRAFLKIQDGCNYICSYCIIPFARGRSRAMQVADVLVQARKLVASGFKEIVLTGVNIGEYEVNTGEKLSDLVRELLAIEGLDRLRLSSVEPNTFSDELLEVMKSSPKFLDHFHIPLQSGDDDILRQMKRKYNVQEYRNIVAKIRSYFPKASIGADVIVGFPGETKEQFENTFKLMRELPITHFHVFPFSKRKRTVAASMENYIPHHEKKSRVKTLIMLGEAKLQEITSSMVGDISEVLFERRNAQGLFEGYTSNFIRVQVDSSEDLSNQIKSVRLISCSHGKLYGEIISI